MTGLNSIPIHYSYSLHLVEIMHTLLTFTVFAYFRQYLSILGRLTDNSCNYATESPIQWPDQPSVIVLIQQSINQMNQGPKELLVSKATKQKVEAAKNFIELRYSKMIQQEQQKKEYWELLNQKMRNLSIPTSQQQQIKRQINHQQAILLREQRKKLTIYDFKSIKIIGKGAFGEVRLCKWSKTNQPVAVKKLKKSEMIFKNKVMQSREERNVLANADKNPWVVGLKCSFQDPDNLYLVMEYLSGGDLMNLLMKKDIFTHEEAQFYIAQILLSLDSVHKMKYIHRDLKPDNILLDVTGHIKLSDFGLCKHTEIRPKRLTDNLIKRDSESSLRQIQKNQYAKEYHKRNRKLAYSAVGTPDYVAPEVQGKIGYTQTVDWWSMGVILFQMLVGYPPFASETPRQTWHKIQNWKKYFHIPADAKVSSQAADLIRKLIADCKQRLGMNGVEEIKAHPFFIGVNWNKIRQRKSPYIPQVKHEWDTQNFDAYEQEEAWFPREGLNNTKGKNKNPQFIGYTYKAVEANNSALIRALVDLDRYKTPPMSQIDSVEYLQQDQDDFQREPPIRFRVAHEKSEKLTKQYSVSTAVLNSKKNEDKQKERYKFYYGDTPQKKPSPGQKLGKKSPKPSPKQSPKRSPKRSPKVSPSTKDKEQRKAKVKLLQKKFGAQKI